MMPDILKILMQFALLTLTGGFIGYLYSKTSKNREIRISLIRELSNLHGRFLALRFRYNSFFLDYQGRDKIAESRLSADDLGKEKHECYREACALLGEFGGLRPLVNEMFPDSDDAMARLYNYYQDWRRHIAGDRPVLQSEDGKSDERYKTGLRQDHAALIKTLRSKL